jgi:all-trans-8'-apo-beta-carotenal 15,15'-oxygenase
MDPETLATTGETSLGIPREETIYSAHSKFDPRSGEWLHFGVRYGTVPQLHISVFHRDGSLNYHRVEPMPRFVYLHDWFVSTNYLVVSLQPVEIDFWPALLGLRSISDSLRWRPEKGNLLLVVPRDGATPRRQMEAPACFMWHSINARDDGHEITADFIGYDNPDHFVGRDPVISAVMQGREGDHTYPGLLRRYRIDLRKGTVGSEILGSGNCEWPRIDDRLLCGAYRTVWTTRARKGDFFPTGIARHDLLTGRGEEYDFGDQIYCSEPYFVPQPGGRHEEGWVLTECLDGRRGRSFLAVLDAGRLGDGPRAIVQLEHHVPFSYHGCWRGVGST